MMDFIKKHLEELFLQVDEEMQRENLNATLSTLLKKVYTEIDEEERSDNAEDKPLVEDNCHESEKEECIEKVSEPMDDGTKVDVNLENRLRRRQSLKARCQAKRQRKIKEIAADRKAARKEAKFLKMLNDSIEKEINEVKELEVVIETRENEIIEANDQIEKVVDDQEALVVDRNTAEIKLEIIQSIMAETKVNNIFRR